MNDLYWRQDAVDRISDQYVNTTGGLDRYAVGINVGLTKAMNALKDMPSAEPERKHGHWVYKDGEMGFGIGAWCCSECGETNESLPFHKCKDPYEYAASKYCACCGARMEENHETD
ncbi:MAG: hypothetical protein IKD66_00665 [Solobacterium sp.]|nr:hypothetical protein [Solobacterium sp.]